MCGTKKDSSPTIDVLDPTVKPPVDKTNGDEPDNKSLLIAVLVSAAVIIILLLVLVIICFVRNRRQKKIIEGINRRRETIDENPEYGIYREDGVVDYSIVTDHCSTYSANVLM